MTRLRTYAGLALLALALFAVVAGLQWFLHVGSCGTGPGTYGPACPSGTGWNMLLLAVGILATISLVVFLPGPAPGLALVLGFGMLAALIAILGWVPAPGEDPTLLGVLVGLPFSGVAVLALVRLVR